MENSRSYFQCLSRIRPHRDSGPDLVGVKLIDSGKAAGSGVRLREYFEMPKPKTNGPNPIDKHVGSRLRMRRLMLNLSQEKLGDALGITFQQVQKYEKGMNRISASRLQQASHILHVSAPFFFDGAPGGHKMGKEAPSPAYVNEFVSSEDGLRLIKAFARIARPAVRHRIVNLVQEIAGVDGD
jgi:transcriptional regulator with XRE-family HTH domain